MVDPTIESVCGGPPCSVSDVLAQKRIFLAREDAQRIVALGRTASGPLLALLERDDASPAAVAAAASLLGAIGEPRAVRPIKARLLRLRYDAHAPLRYHSMLGEALACLGRAGLRALQSLARPDARVPSREAAIDGLVVAQTPGTDDVLVRLFAEEENPHLCGVLAQALCGRTHPQAVPLVEAALHAERIDASSFSWAHFTQWKTDGTLPWQDHWTPRTVAFFLPAHQAEFQRIEYDLLHQSQMEMERATDLEYVYDLLSLRAVVAGRVREKRPCTCGSGKVESACCETWLKRFSRMHWRVGATAGCPASCIATCPPATSSSIFSSCLPPRTPCVRPCPAWTTTTCAGAAAHAVVRTGPPAGAPDAGRRYRHVARAPPSGPGLSHHPPGRLGTQPTGV